MQFLSVAVGLLDAHNVTRESADGMTILSSVMAHFMSGLDEVWYNLDVLLSDLIKHHRHSACTKLY